MCSQETVMSLGHYIISNACITLKLGFQAYNCLKNMNSNAKQNVYPASIDSHSNLCSAETPL